MAKIRVFQIASEINFDKNKLVALCKQNGIDVKSPLSSVDDDLAGQIRDLIKNEETSDAASADGVIRSMRDLPSISSDDLEGRASLNEKSKKAKLRNQKILYNPNLLRIKSEPEASRLGNYKPIQPEHAGSNLAKRLL